MKINKEKILSKAGVIANNTKELSSNITKKTKGIVLDTKEKINTKIEKDEKLITQEDMLKILDGIYGNVLNGLGKKSPTVEEFANDYLSKEKDPSKAAKK